MRDIATMYEYYNNKQLYNFHNNKSSHSSRNNAGREDNKSQRLNDEHRWALRDFCSKFHLHAVHTLEEETNLAAHSEIQSVPSIKKACHTCRRQIRAPAFVQYLQDIHDVI